MAFQLCAIQPDELHMRYEMMFGIVLNDTMKFTQSITLLSVHLHTQKQKHTRRDAAALKHTNRLRCMYVPYLC